jgi:hypothetical protein
MKGRLQVEFPDHYYDDLYKWQDFHECTHFLLAGTTTESSVGTVTQVHVPAVFAVPSTFSTPPPAAVVIKMEDTTSILQDTLQRMESMFAGAIYQNTQGTPQSQQYTSPQQQYTLIPQQYAPPLEQYAPPPQQYTLLLQSYTTSAIPSSTGPFPE